MTALRDLPTAELEALLERDWKYHTVNSMLDYLDDLQEEIARRPDRTRFTCPCGYRATSQFTADVINSLTGECPVCTAPALPGQFT